MLCGSQEKFGLSFKACNFEIDISDTRKHEQICCDEYPYETHKPVCRSLQCFLPNVSSSWNWL